MDEHALKNQVIGGSLAGITADVITHPLSTIKTRIQVQGSGGGSHGATTYGGVCSGLLQILRAEGPVALYRGLGAVLFGAAPAQGLYFGGYETAKGFLGGGQSGIGNFSAGICAQLCGSLVWVPMDVIKERLQVEGQLKVTNAYSGSFNACKQILLHEGAVGLYRAFPIHQMTWAPFNGCYFAVYEAFRQAEGRPSLRQTQNLQQVEMRNSNRCFSVATGSQTCFKPPRWRTLLQNSKMNVTFALNFLRRELLM
eukprot:TRINITY_DN11572_c0_g1_i2.p1 TRINITY_DN11572_c0_g1~~TRINITY_DN11572_c0_g1_i2.p1  ORF type:complete len:254 (+),score=38.99 TRINITY_DN11572_c0_g1_i2:35-796(+)